jgi:hypothetical protein
VILEGFPADDPFRTAIRDRARALLVESGYLTADELGVLPVKDAVATALRRLHGQVSRSDLARVGATQSGQRSVDGAHRAV